MFTESQAEGWAGLGHHGQLYVCTRRMLNSSPTCILTQRCWSKVPLAFQLTEDEPLLQFTSKGMICGSTCISAQRRWSVTGRIKGLDWFRFILDLYFWHPELKVSAVVLLGLNTKLAKHWILNMATIWLSRLMADKNLIEILKLLLSGLVGYNSYLWYWITILILLLILIYQHTTLSTLSWYQALMSSCQLGYGAMNDQSQW